MDPAAGQTFWKMNGTRMKQSTIFKNRSVQNAAYLIAGRVLQMAFGFIVTLLTARFLGPSDYGLINYATAYTAFFTAICTLGINNVLVKEFIDHPGEEGRIIGTSLGLRAASSLLSFAVILRISCILDAGEPITILVVVLAGLGRIFHIAETFNYWFQSRLESKITAGATLGAYLLSSAYKLFLLITGGGVQLFALATSLDYLCLGAILYGQYRKHRGGKLHFSWAYGKLLLEKSHPFILSGMMIAVYGHTAKLMLKQLIGDAEIGYVPKAESTFVCHCIPCFDDGVGGHHHLCKAHRNHTLRRKLPACGKNTAHRNLVHRFFLPWSCTHRMDRFQEQAEIPVSRIRRLSSCKRALQSNPDSPLGCIRRSNGFFGGPGCYHLGRSILHKRYP